MIQELKLTHRHHMARPSPGIPLQIKICLHSFVFFCDDIGSLTFNRGRNTKWRGANTHTMTAEEKYRMHKSLVWHCVCCIFHSFPPSASCVLSCGAQVSWAGTGHGPWSALSQALPGAGPGSVLAERRVETQWHRGDGAQTRAEKYCQHSETRWQEQGLIQQRVIFWQSEDLLISSEKSAAARGSVYRWSARVW